MINKFRGFFILIVIILIFVSPLKGDGYLGFSIPYMNLSGKSFEGDTIQRNGLVLISIPSLSDNIELGFFFMDTY